MGGIGRSSVTLDRDDVISGLREVVGLLHTWSQPSVIRIVGGAAMLLAYDADRRSTVDVDGPFEPALEVLRASAIVATKRGWPRDWLNDAAKQFIPSGFGDSARWHTIYSHADVVVQVAEPETMLAMKLHAAQRRGRREAEDLSTLFALCGVNSPDDAEAVYSRYYPGDEFTERTYALVDAILGDGPSAPPTPEPVSFN